MVNIILNGEKVQAKENQTILDVAREHNIEIPTLCHLDLHQIGYYNNPASCRVCVVELGNGKLVPSCSARVAEGMEIKTDSLKAIKARRMVVELLLSNHPKECLVCAKNQKCDLQNMAADLGVREIKYEGERSQHDIDWSSLSLIRDSNKCIICRRCETMCSDIQTVHALSTNDRGFDTYVGVAYNLPMHETTCTFCGQCLTVCPTGALTEVNNANLVWNALASDKYVVVQTAPAVRVALGEEFGLEPGTNVTGKMVSALRKLGFDRVFDTDFAADLTIMEESAEFMERLKNGGPFPLITSCCPAWVNFMETQFADFIKNPSSAKSPHEMFGAVAKSYYAEKMGIDPEDMVVVSVMPCVAKKYESARQELENREGLADVDIVITTRELAQMIKEAGLQFTDLPDEEFDDPLGESTGAGLIFGATGGVITATLRTCHKILTGNEDLVLEFDELKGFKGVKTTTVNINGQELRIAVTNGLGNIRKILEAIRDGKEKFHAVEVMACPGGCIGGAGQPYHHGDLSILDKRTAAIYGADKDFKTRISMDNESIKRLYDEYFGEPLSDKAHELLHTSYQMRPRF